MGYFLPRGGGGGGGGCCAERRFAEIDVLGSETSVEIRGVMSTDVTEVSESFRLGRIGELRIVVGLKVGEVILYVMMRIVLHDDEK